MFLDEASLKRRHMVTPEDAAILRDQLYRIMTLCPHGGARASSITIRAIKNACGDYIEPCPYDWTDMLAMGVLT
jgi:hypothetical protein